MKEFTIEDLGSELKEAKNHHRLKKSLSFFIGQTFSIFTAKLKNYFSNCSQ
jgi:hypothetical protein